MGLFRRIFNLFEMFVSLFVERAENAVPLERRLAHDRARKAEQFKQQMDRATTVGQVANLMVTQLAEAKINVRNLRDEARAHVQAAKAAAARADTATEERERARAASLAEELAEAEADLTQLESMVQEALADKDAALQMVLQQSAELEKLARQDARLVAQVYMTDMREQQLQLQEEMLALVPSDQDNLRARVGEQAKKREARYQARRDVVDALWQQKRRKVADQQAQISAQGANILAQLEAEVGYVRPAAIPAARPLELEAPASEETGGEES